MKTKKPRGHHSLNAYVLVRNNKGEIVKMPRKEVKATSKVVSRETWKKEVRDLEVASEEKVVKKKKVKKSKK